MDQAAPLAKWDLPPEFQTLRRLMEARMIKAGRREYVQVLRLLETFDLGDLHVAVKTALRMAVLHQSPDKRGVPLPVKMVSQLTQTWHSQVRSFC